MFVHIIFLINFFIKNMLNAHKVKAGTIKINIITFISIIDN